MSPGLESGATPAERRRHQRLPAPPGLELTIPVTVQGEVIDISESGALISTGLFLSVGDRARLSLLVGREPFGAWARVMRAEPGTRVDRMMRYYIGVEFTSLDEQNRQVLQRFVRRDPPRAG